MKIIKILILITPFFIAGCTEDETVTPPVNYSERYQVTTAILTFEDSTTTLTESVKYQDLDYQGGTPPMVDTINLLQGRNYDVILTMLNENITPSLDVSQEIRNNPNFYRIFYTLNGNIQNRIIINITDLDDNAPEMPLGLRTYFQVAAVGAATGSLKITLTRYPEEKTLQPGADTLFTAEFPVVLQ